METLLLVLDLTGAFVFALSGVTAGVRHRLDLFGVLVLSYAAGNVGGMARDLLIGAVPPAAISDWRYLAGSTAPGSALRSGVARYSSPLAAVRTRSRAGSCRPRHDVRLIADKTTPCERESGIEPLSAAGVPIWIDAQARIAHGKTMVIYGAVTLTGSMNWTAALR